MTSGQVLAVLEEGAAAATAPPAKAARGAGESKPSERAAPAAAARPAERTQTSGETRAAARTAAPAGADKLAPSVRRLVEEHHLDTAGIAGSGRDGRITKADVLTHLTTKEAAPTASAPAQSRAPAAPQPAMPAGPHAERRVPMTRLRARIAERLLQVQSTAAMLTTFNEVDLTEVNGLRARYKERFEKQHGVRLGFTSFFVKACIEALRRYPVINASVDGNDIVYHDYYDIGIAVSTDRGLVVPVLRDADARSFAEIEQSVGGFATRARDGAITLECYAVPKRRWEKGAGVIALEA